MSPSVLSYFIHLVIFSCVEKVWIYQTQSFLQNVRLKRNETLPVSWFSFSSQKVMQHHPVEKRAQVRSVGVSVFTPAASETAAHFCIGTASGGAVIFKSWKNSDINYICQSKLIDWLYNTLCSWSVAQHLGDILVHLNFHSCRFASSDFRLSDLKDSSGWQHCFFFF